MPRPGPRRPLAAIRLDQDDLNYLQQRANRETNGNMSELVRRLVKDAKTPDVGPQAISSQDACELIHDAMDAADASYHERDRGIIDTTSDVLANALLAAGWQPPTAGQQEITRAKAQQTQELT